MIQLIHAPKSDAALTYDELFEPFLSACKTKEHWTLGVESERFGVRASTGEPIQYAGSCGVLEVLSTFQNRFGWAPESEVPGGPTILLNRSRTQITLEPGGQVELSGSPQPDIHGVHQEVQLHVSELRRLSEGLGLAWLGVGFHPLAQQQQLDWVPKLRYGVMRKYLASRGDRALDMMRRTATVQVNLDFASERDALRKLRLALRISPVVAATFANSPFVEGRLFGGRSARQEVWFHVDPDRQGLLPQLWNPRSTLRDYVEWALDAPMFLLKRQGAIVANTGQTFRAFLQDGFKGHRATPADWKMHLNTLFPEVRLKNTLEMRGADSLPFGLLCALPALWAGVLYDDIALERAESLTESWTYAEMNSVRAQAVKLGLRTPFRGKFLADTAQQLLQIAREGLSRRARLDPESGRDESAYLEAIAPLTERALTPADRLMAGLATRSGGLRDDILRRVGP